MGVRPLSSIAFGNATPGIHPASIPYISAHGTQAAGDCHAPMGLPAHLRLNRPEAEKDRGGHRTPAQRGTPRAPPEVLWDDKLTAVACAWHNRTGEEGDPGPGNGHIPSGAFSANGRARPKAGQGTGLGTKLQRKDNSCGAGGGGGRRGLSGLSGSAAGPRAHAMEGTFR